MTVITRTSRITGTPLQVGRAQEFGVLPDPDAPWLTVCCHSNTVASRTRDLAFRTCGLDFCQECREEWE